MLGGKPPRGGQLRCRPEQGWESISARCLILDKTPVILTRKHFILEFEMFFGRENHDHNGIKKYLFRGVKARKKLLVQFAFAQRILFSLQVGLT